MKTIRHACLYFLSAPFFMFLRLAGRRNASRFRFTALAAGAVRNSASAFRGGKGFMDAAAMDADGGVCCFPFRACCR
ncbi:hypothetical protein C5O12_07270 [Akkermansia muciniphila]|nr:hypothetical protein CXU05_00310 [Akkermansia muciniphila]QAA48442.1 hypothetical protein C1O40_07795 [Akkermansia muciniphila]QAA62283.1 hypothetical protein C1O59_07295 [Akkermansia muciniphila]QHV11903.1 hypothetical protein C5N97_07435 [Akkermansia muciniphila]QHV19109.1 hypothetical protein C5O11_07360 [Akkermansia muciniphila]